MLVFHMGVAGVAYATILAQALSAVLVLVTLVRSHGDYHLDLPIHSKYARLALAATWHSYCLAGTKAVRR